jgi:rsbT co-antagonist protein RsbR
MNMSDAQGNDALEQRTQELLTQQVLRALQERVFDNQGFLQPKQLQGIAGELALLSNPDRLLQQDFGQRLSQQGLALSSLHHAGAALVRTLLQTCDLARAQLSLERVLAVAQDFYKEEMRRVRVEQQQIQEAVRQAIAQHEAQAEQLQAMIYELSTPIVPVYQGILVVPLIGTIDSRRSDEITTRLLDSINEHHAAMVIIDITGVPVVNAAVAQHLVYATRSAALLGVGVILVGVNPEVAQTLVQLGVVLTGMVTLSDLEQGIAYALRSCNLAIQPI